VRGVVVDEAGRPVSRARVRERSAQPYMTSQTFSLTTGAEGRFELTHRTGAYLSLSAEADGYAIGSTNVALGRRESDLRIVLGKAGPARLRVLGERDAPLAGAAVRTVEFRNRGQVLDWSGQTDAEGRVVWSNAPQQDVVVLISAKPYPNRTVTLNPNAGETVARLRANSDQALVVRVSVTEEKTGKPVAGGEVSRGMPYGQGFTNWGVAGADGKFQQELTAKSFEPSKCRARPERLLVQVGSALSIAGEVPNCAWCCKPDPSVVELPDPSSNSQNGDASTSAVPGVQPTLCGAPGTAGGLLS